MLRVQLADPRPKSAADLVTARNCLPGQVLRATLNRTDRDLSEPEWINIKDIWGYALKLAGYLPSYLPKLEELNGGGKLVPAEHKSVYIDVERFLWDIGELGGDVISWHCDRSAGRRGMFMTEAEECELLSKAIEGGVDIMLGSYFDGVPLEYIIPDDENTEVLLGIAEMSRHELEKRRTNWAYHVAALMSVDIFGEFMRYDVNSDMQDAFKCAANICEEKDRASFDIKVLQRLKQTAGAYWPYILDKGVYRDAMKKIDSRIDALTLFVEHFV